MQASLPGAAEPQDDRDLAQRCTTQVSAREELFRRHAPAAYRLARRLMGNNADADDVVQDAFIQVFASLPSYRGDAPLATWVHRIAVRCAMRMLRRRKTRQELEIDVAGEPLGLGPASVPSGMLLRRVQALIEQLAPTRRAVFVLHEVEGHSLPEVAELMGISVTAAKKRVWRARLDLEQLVRRSPGLSELLERRDEADHG